MTTEFRVPARTGYEAMRWVIKGMAACIARQTVIGLENVPKEGAFVLTANHMSIFEPPVVFMQIPRQMVVFAADTWRTTPGVAQLLKVLGVIWVNRKEADPEAIKLALSVLKAGHPLGIAPEGTRSKTGALIKGKVGAAYLADRAGVPILPVVVIGEVLSNNLKRQRLTPLTCIIGKPYRLPNTGKRAKGPELEAYTELIMCQLAALLPPRYHGVYAEHPKLAEIAAQTAQT